MHHVESNSSMKTLRLCCSALQCIDCYIIINHDHDDIGYDNTAPCRTQLIYEDPEVDFHLYDEDEHCDHNDDVNIASSRAQLIYEDPEAACYTMTKFILMTMVMTILFDSN